MVFNTAFLFILGLAVGSFLNVVAFRYTGEGRLFHIPKINGRSHCRTCERTLAWYELIPVVSFIFQLGTCRGCKQQLSWQYPLVEVASGVACAFVPEIIWRVYQVPFALTLGMPPLWYYLVTVLFILVSLTLILISAIDARLTIIPDQSTLLIVFLGIVLVGIHFWYGLFADAHTAFVGFYAHLFGFQSSLWLNHIVGAFFGLIFFGFITLVSRGRAMGMGDVKLAGALGLLFGWPDTLVALMLSFIIGSLWGILVLARRKKTFSSAVPFGPFIALGAATTVFFGQFIVNGYFRIFG